MNVRFFSISNSFKCLFPRRFLWSFRDEYCRLLQILWNVWEELLGRRAGWLCLEAKEIWYESVTNSPTNNLNARGVPNRSCKCAVCILTGIHRWLIYRCQLPWFKFCSEFGAYVSMQYYSLCAVTKTCDPSENEASIGELTSQNSVDNFWKYVTKKYLICCHSWKS